MILYFVVATVYAKPFCVEIPDGVCTVTFNLTSYVLLLTGCIRKVKFIKLLLTFSEGVHFTILDTRGIKTNR